MSTSTTGTTYWTVKALVQAYFIGVLTEHFTETKAPDPGVHARRVMMTPGNRLDEFFLNIASFELRDDWTTLIKAGAIVAAVEMRAKALGAEPGKLEENRVFTDQLIATIQRGQTHRKVVATIVAHTDAFLKQLTPKTGDDVAGHDELLIKAFVTELTHKLDELRSGWTPEKILAVYHARLHYLLAKLGVPPVPDAEIEALDTFIWNALEPYQV
jgi:hypothetical protein